MSNAVYPPMPGLSWPVAKIPQWSTRAQTSVSGKEIRVSFMSYPIWQFTLTYDVLRSGVQKEYQQLVDFFNARRGSWDSFLFNDVLDNSVTAEQFGSGDGVATAFQLLRRIYAGGFSEPVQNLNNAPSIFVNSVLKTVTTDYTIGTTGIVTFTSPPAAAAALTWTGTFYYRVRFLKDMLDFEEFMLDLWSLKKVELRSVKL